MATSLADSPPASPAAQTPPEGIDGVSPAPPTPSSATAPGAAPPPTAAAVHSCARCGAALAPGQDWCLSCGAGAPGSLGTPSWRSAATIIGLIVVLVLGAAAAAVAALSKGAGKAPVVTKTVAQLTTPTTSTPATPGATATTPGTLGTTPATKSGLPSTTVKPPKIPLTAATPKASEKTTTTPTTTTPASTTPTSTTPTSTTPSSGATTGESSAEDSQAAILLDTNAASTYNPYGYAASGFGDPALAIDGDPATAWTAQLNPATAPKMAQGLLIDLKAKQKVAVLELISSTPGMTVQVYGAKGATAPASITDPAWIPLSRLTVAKKKHLRLALRHANKQFTFITLWISNAPESSVGAPTAPGHVDVNEVELFPPKS